VAAREEDLVDAPLYVMYRKKKREYRVHVAFGRVIDVQQKRKRTNYDGTVDYAVRNHHTGWVYCREDVVDSTPRDNLAIRAVDALGLDFGAVDIIYNEHLDAFYLLEVNTAPGLEGTTVEKYNAAFAARISEM
jgi:D-alanine-D-alanine ligase-like ATP-grasp enzyme